MRIQSLSKILVVPVLMLAGLVYFLTEYIDREYSIGYMVPAMLAVVIYIFHGNIDFWYLKRHPYGLDNRLLQWLKHDFILYNRLSRAEQLEFEYRLELYLNGRLFLAKGKEDVEVPEDIKALIAGYGIYMGIHYPDYLFGDIDRIFLYAHPFPTPRFPRLHSVEFDHEDGVIILNSSLAIQAHLHPDKYYNIMVHAYAQVMEFLHGPYPDGLSRDHLDEVVPWNYDEICEQLGLEDVPSHYIHVHHYIVFPEKYRLVFPEHARALDLFFRFL